MRRFLVLAAAAALGLSAPAALGAVRGPSAASAAVASVLLDDPSPPETCEQRGYREVCVPRCKGLPLGGGWAGLEEPPNQGQCYTECMREIREQCS